MAETYSSAAMRERDKAVMAKHRIELSEKDARYARLKRVNDDMMNLKHTEASKAERFAKVLGFRDIDEALLVVDLADHEVSYKGTVDLVESLRKEVETMQTDKAEMTETLEILKETDKEKATKIKKLELELAHLRSRYDDLQGRHERQSKNFMNHRQIWCRDRAIWRGVKEHLFDQDTGKSESYFRKNREMLIRVITEKPDADEADKENDPTPNGTPNASPTRRQTPRGASSPIACTSRLPHASLLFSSSTSPTPSRKGLPGNILVPDSDSETEPESSFTSPQRRLSPLKLLEAPKTSPIKKKNEWKSSFDQELEPLRPGERLFDSPRKQRIMPLRSHSPIHDLDFSDRPRKKRRTSEQPPRSPARLKTGFATSPRRLKDRRTAIKTEPFDTPISSPSASTSKLPKPSVASTSASTSKLPKPTKGSASTGFDYSKYKGRGRYSNVHTGQSATGNDAHNTTINAAFAIDPERNNGLDYAYDEVVRGKEKRRNLHGGDCECCKEYYEGVGPMPKRLEMPLWKSPDPKRKALSPAALTPRREHKKGISRHRAQWQPGGTPPDYWNIGFPDTQEVDRINQKAKDMREKRWDEVGKDGRYKRR